MAHGQAKRNHARALTPAFTRYTTLPQATKDHRSQRLFAAFCIAPITSVFLYYTLNMPLHPYASFNAFPAVYVMTESRMRLQTKPQAGRGQRGLCRGGGSRDRPAAPAGPRDLSDPQAAISARR